MSLLLIPFALAAEPTPVEQSSTTMQLSATPEASPATELQLTAEVKSRRKWTASALEDASSFSVGMEPALLRGMHLQPAASLSIAEGHTGTELKMLLPTDGGGFALSLGVSWRLKVPGVGVGAVAGIRAESDTDFWTPVPGEPGIVLGVAIPFGFWLQPIPQAALELGGEWRTSFLGGGGGRPLVRAGGELLLWRPVYLGAAVEYQAAPSGKDQNVWQESVDMEGWTTGQTSFSARVGVRM